MKKFMSFLLTAVMVLSMLPVTAFAADNTATTMRLAKTQGTVTVTNATDKVVKQTDNMKLYNGYKLKTDAESYAWISLDDTKAAKLDANSELSVQKSGKKLTLYLSSGNVFFNVKESLKGDESLNIKTSTMTMGIRGTSGCVRVINPRVSEVHLMTGTVEVLVEHPEINLSKSAIITAGTVATSLIDKEAIEVSGEPVEIVIEELMEETVCGNCAVEIADDVDLQERIEEETDLDVEEIISEAEEKLADDEKAAEEKQEAIEEAIDNQEFPEVVDPYFEETVESSDDGGSTGGTPVVPPTEPDTPSEPEEPVDPGVVSSWAELVEKIKTYNSGTEDMTITLGCNLPSAEDLSSGVGLELLPAVNDANGATLTLNLSEYTLAMEDTWVNNGKLVITNTDGMIGEYNDPDPFFNVIENNGHLTLERGTIVVYNQGTGVFNSEGATF
ncbi:MAG: FecR domain-containing protein, partial [Firmicutes bacterium]|nr:FecR domain-containing protein [Bacillota bacterium]